MIVDLFEMRRCFDQKRENRPLKPPCPVAVAELIFPMRGRFDNEELKFLEFLVVRVVAGAGHQRKP